MRDVARSWAELLVWAWLCVGCNKETAGEVASGAPAAAAAPSTAPGVAPAVAAASAAPLTGFDPCVVGSYRAKSVTLSSDQVKAAGGAGVKMQIEPSGRTTLDFGSMENVIAGGSGMSFDFRYAGTATGTLKTPARGKFESENPDYSKLNVTANVKVPGAGTVPMFEATPVTELVKMASGVAAAAKGLPGALGAAGAPKGIDSAPIFSSSAYECRPDSLTLTGAQNVVWEFVRARS
jgi:hypothetical protein